LDLRPTKQHETPPGISLRKLYVFAFAHMLKVMICVLLTVLDFLWIVVRANFTTILKRLRLRFTLIKMCTYFPNVKVYVANYNFPNSFQNSLVSW